MPNRVRRSALLIGRLLAGLLVAAGSQAAWAGGGPTNLILVVNANHDDSKQIANHYARLRDLPASNVVYLDYDGPLETCSGETFRTEILRPVLTEIDARGLSLQADLIAYSAGFPWRVNLAGDYPEGVKFAPQLNPQASLTGATYLFSFVLGQNPGVVSQQSNWYVPAPTGQTARVNLRSCRTLASVGSRGFRSRNVWREGGKPTRDPKAGRRYLLSTLLGVTTGRGNTVEEVLAYLERAVAAEASPPDGTFYFQRRPAPRSAPRHACFEPVAQQLRELGAKALVKAGAVPRGARDIAGLMTGAKDLDLRDLRFQPGAIAENLTSYGGVLTAGAGQTPLTELLRAGATGASGTVFEPYAIQCKFPLPSMHLHYRRGCSLAESFYQSVASPYQLLVVGDPLCQPWATRPDLAIEGWPTADASGLDVSALGDLGLAEFAGLPVATPQDPPQDPVDEPKTPSDKAPKPLLVIKPLVASTAGEGAAFWELFLDGRLRMRLPSGTDFPLTAEQLGPGWHDLRCVAANPDPIESQRVKAGEIEVLEAGGQPIEPVLLRIEDPEASFAGRLAVAATAPGAERIVIRQHSREVGVIEGVRGGVLIPAERLGRGPVRLQAVAQPSGAASPPVWVTID